MPGDLLRLGQPTADLDDVCHHALAGHAKKPRQLSRRSTIEARNELQRGRSQLGLWANVAFGSK
jgi:hypothetical protein